VCRRRVRQRFAPDVTIGHAIADAFPISCTFALTLAGAVARAGRRRLVLGHAGGDPGTGTAAGDGDARRGGA